MVKAFRMAHYTNVWKAQGHHSTILQTFLNNLFPQNHKDKCIKLYVYTNLLMLSNDMNYLEGQFNHLQVAKECC